MPTKMKTKTKAKRLINVDAYRKRRGMERMTRDEFDSIRVGDFVKAGVKVGGRGNPDAETMWFIVTDKGKDHLVTKLDNTPGWTHVHGMRLGDTVKVRLEHVYHIMRKPFWKLNPDPEREREVIRLMDEGLSISEAAEAVGVHYETARKWAKKHGRSARPRRTYTEEQIEEVLEMLEHTTASQASRDTGIPASTIIRWASQRRPGVLKTSSETWRPTDDQESLALRLLAEGLSDVKVSEATGLARARVRRIRQSDPELMDARSFLVSDETRQEVVDLLVEGLPDKTIAGMVGVSAPTVRGIREQHPEVETVREALTEQRLERIQQALELYYRDGLSNVEVARAMDVSPRTVIWWREQYEYIGSSDNADEPEIEPEPAGPEPPAPPPVVGMALNLLEQGLSAAEVAEEIGLGPDGGRTISRWQKKYGRKTASNPSSRARRLMRW